MTKVSKNVLGNKAEKKENENKNMDNKSGDSKEDKAINKKPVAKKKTTRKKPVAKKKKSSEKDAELSLKTEKKDKNKSESNENNSEITKNAADLVKNETENVKKAKVKEKTKSRATKKKVETEKKVAKKKVETRHRVSSANKRTTKKPVAKKSDLCKLTNFNTYLFHEGKNYTAYNIMGSHMMTVNRRKGVQFATWAPKAQNVYLVGDFNNFEVMEDYKLDKITDHGIFAKFFPGIKEGAKYKYCIVDENGNEGEYKSDPYGIKFELRPNNATIVTDSKSFKWTDSKWIKQNLEKDIFKIPINIYELHLGSWKKHKDGTFLSYDELSKELPKYLKDMGYTHVEIMPVMEHPLDESWGYQATGFFAPTSRYGEINGLKKLINCIHNEGIGVIFDWVPGHFCKDSHGLYHFDGSPTYEYQEEWRAENKGWGTCNFDLGRPEVKSFLISNALYFYREFHIDGLRVDAVSSILYLDYSRSNGEWVPNKYGGNGNLEGIQFFKDLNTAVFKEYKNALMIAEESTSWPNVTKSPEHDGLGFNFKWNMGWMNDTLEYVKIDPKDRKYHHKNITFAMMYNYAENYILPLSHDEVVHGKGSLVNKMWGDYWNKFAGLRVFIGYMIGHPGKKLTFMGSEFAQFVEWRDYEELQWNLIDEHEMNKKTLAFFKDINKFYKENRALWLLDYDYSGFTWIEPNNNEQSILIFVRKTDKDSESLIFIVNFTSEVYYDYQIGVPYYAEYEEVFNTDDEKYGGSGQVMGTKLYAEKAPFHNQQYSIKVKVPPMAALVLKVNNFIDENKEIKDNNTTIASETEDKQ